MECQGPEPGGAAWWPARSKQQGEQQMMRLESGSWEPSDPGRCLPPCQSSSPEDGETTGTIAGCPSFYKVHGSAHSILAGLDATQAGLVQC